MYSTPDTEAGSVFKERGAGLVDLRVQSVRLREVLHEMRSLVVSRLKWPQPALERHFDLSLSGFESVQFLCYGFGDFYRPHADVTDDPEVPAYA
jgi:hypothetical protein